MQSPKECANFMRLSICKKFIKKFVFISACLFFHILAPAFRHKTLFYTCISITRRSPQCMLTAECCYNCLLSACSVCSVHAHCSVHVQCAPCMLTVLNAYSLLSDAKCVLRTCSLLLSACLMHAQTSQW